MSKDRPKSNSSESSLQPLQRDNKGEYVVVARRYRPRSFAELVGQQQVSQALANAILTNRVGHAYLFTGARGVGKTSTARILAKALNCVSGPAPTSCDHCDICESIARGDDVDVLEIDGASNRGIDEIRQLRSNVNIRPSRARFKIYIIDEVHMLTTPAFNALLKTLEEPPEHVKFIFCTTDPEKIPITVLSRCQRFDFPPVETGAILTRLQQIAKAEGVEAETEALQLLARRAGGSMRDSQSLLEQLLSFCGKQITADDVHAMLGTAPGGRLTKLASYLLERDVASALGELDAAVAEGVDAGQLAEQTLGYFRDMLAAVAGCPAEMMLHSAASEYQHLRETGQQMGLQTILAAVQILDQTITRLRQSTHVRTLVEVALVRICSLEDLDQLPALIEQLRGTGNTASSSRTPPPQTTGSSKTASHSDSGSSLPAAQKKNELTTTPAEPSLGMPSGGFDLTDQSALEVWQQALAAIEDMTADFAGYYDRVAISAPNRLVISFRREYNHHKESCERPERKAKIEQALARITGKQVRIDFDVLPDSQPPMPIRQSQPSKRQRMRDKEKHALVRKAIELFDAEVFDLDDSRCDETRIESSESS